MKLSSHDRIIKIVLSGLFAAIIFVLTAFFPIPLGHGYANAGDVFVVLSGIMMGPWAGLAAAGVGSAMADLYLGYSVYAPATFVIKGLMAVVASLILKSLKNKRLKTAVSYKGLMAVVACLIFKSFKNKRLKTAVSYIVCELIMVSGYFLFETIFFGIGVALADVVGNLLQAAFGAAVGITLTSVLMKTRVMNEFMK